MDSILQPGGGRAWRQEGNYLGRSTALPSLLPRLGGINSKSQSAVSIRDTGDAIVLAAWQKAEQIAHSKLV